MLSNMSSISLPQISTELQNAKNLPAVSKLGEIQLGPTSRRTLPLDVAHCECEVLSLYSQSI